MHYQILVTDNNFIRDRWSQLSIELLESFRNATFNSGFSIQSLIEEIQNDIQSNKKIMHVIAIDGDNKIIGCLFSIKAFYQGKCCEVGWFFTSNKLTTKVRISVSDDILNAVHKLVKSRGYKCIETDMGTIAGQRFLSKRFAYIYCPEKHKNRWIKVL